MCEHLQCYKVVVELQSFQKILFSYAKYEDSHKYRIMTYRSNSRPKSQYGIDARLFTR